MPRIASIILFYLGLTQLLLGQPKWVNTYLDGMNPDGEAITVSYDKGFLFAGRYGPNYPTYNWLIKTDINGEILWNKTLGNGVEPTVISKDVFEDSDGNIFLCGSSYILGNGNSDPLLMKLNPCGEKEWCKIFLEPERNNFISAMAVLSDGSCIVLMRYMNPDISRDRLSLAKVSYDGNLLWMKSYNSPDSLIYNEDAYDVTLCPDGGFIITGVCDYQDSNPPNYLWLKAYYLKVDSAGNYLWETVVEKETNLPGGSAWSTLLSPDSTHLYSAISKYYNTGDSNAASLVKMNLSGDVIDVYDLAIPNYYGKHFQFVFINDSTLAGSAIWGPWGSHPRAVLFDTLGNTLGSRYLLDNHHMSYVRITDDNKLLFLTSHIIEDTDESFTYLFKLDQNLNDDTLYNAYIDYDTLCPYPIVSDTITLEGCDVIVGVSEPDENEYRVKKEALLIYPNPANNIVTIRYSRLDAGSKIQIYDLYGRRMGEILVPSGQQEVSLNVSNYPEGIYVAVLKDESGIIARGKFVVKRP